MALDTRRYQSRAAEQAPVSLNSTALPGLIILALGIFIIITGIILLAAFGIPNDVNLNPKSISGPAVLGCGFLVSVFGVFYTLYLKRKARRLMAEKRRQQQMQMRNERPRAQRHGSSMAPMTTVSLSRQQSTVHYPPTAYDQTAYSGVDYNHYIQQLPQYCSNYDYYSSGMNTASSYCDSPGACYPDSYGNANASYSAESYSNYPYSSRVET